MLPTKSLLCAALSASLLLSACSTAPYLRPGERPPEEAVNLAQTQMVKAAAGSRGAVDRFSGPKLAGKEVRITAAAAPAAKWLDEPFIYVSDAQNLVEVLQSVSEQVEHRVRVGSMDDDWADGQKLKLPFAVDWRKGTLSSFLLHIAGRLNASWRVVDGDIEFFQNETRSFQVSLPPGSRTMNSSLTLGSAGGGSSGGGSGGGGGGGSGGGSQSTVSSSLTINTFEAVLNGVKSLVSGEAGGDQKKSGKSSQVVGNPELGLITVTGRPAMLERIARHIESINDRVAQNVFVQIKVMSVSINKDDYVGLGLDGILTRGLSKVSLESPAAKPSGSGAPGFLTLSRTGGGLAGSEVVFGLLKQAGEVAIVRSGQVIAANGQPAGIQVADEVNYLAQVSTSVVANAGAQTSLTPGSRTVGFTASVLPLIMADSRLLLQYTLNLSSLLGLTQNSSGGQTIQTPQISSQTLQQQAYVRDGESIVLFGFEQDRSAADRSLGIAGGGSNTSRNRQAIVIVMDVARVGNR
ncbi:hypothetical protein [Paucibacter soli]|uniref:hypothetical protein n=1 Tax=Paucibacter soli TaxID=3133433 RepID=UPI0030B05BA6